MNTIIEIFEGRFTLAQLRNKLFVVIAMFLMVAVFTPNARAQVVSCGLPNGNFALSVSVGAGCGSMTANTAQTFFDALSTSSLQSMTGITYTGSEQTSIAANFNSLLMSVSYPTLNATTMTLDIPGLGIVGKSFTSAISRDDSKQQMVDYLKKTNIIGQIMKYQATNSPTSPITGAGGMLPNAVSSDFNQNFTDSATNIASSASMASSASQDKVTPNLIGISMSYSSLTSLDNKTKVITLPLSYTIRNNIDPRRQLILSMPITQMDTNGAKSYSAALGAAYRFPMNDNWTLTPSGKMSVVGSVDMATVAGMYSLSMTSTYQWRLENYDVSMGNMLAYNKTLKFKTGEYSFDPDIRSTVLRNGVMLSQPVNWGGKKLSLEYSAIDTRYNGTQLYIPNSQEFGITVGTNKSSFSSRSFLRGGLTYLHGRDTKGITANIGYWF
jgi:hypothetical protein